MKKTIYHQIKTMSLAAALLLTAGIMTSCSQDTEEAGSSAAQNMLRFELYDGGAMTRSTTDAKSMATVFSVGDRAGLYIVKGGEVKAANVVLTYNNLGEWEAAAPIMATADLTGANFYAYYPYSDAVTFDVAAANPLQAYVDGVKPADDQSSIEKYEQTDIMVASTSMVGSKNTVSLQLQHQKSLVYIELPNVSYTFDNEDMEPYVLSQAEDAVFTLNGIAVKPYMDPASQSYRFVVTPGQSGSLKITFTNGGKDCNYEVSQLSQLAAGQYAKYVIDDGVKQTHFGTLQVGDYYCADGTLVSKDTPAGSLPANVTGVIYRIGTTEGLKTANAKWSHAMVVSLNEPSAKAKWGSSNGVNVNWYTAYGLEVYRKIENATHEVESPDNGYQATKAWMSIPADADEYKYCSVMQTTLTEWRTSNPLSEASTGWYIPSVRDWINIEAVYDSDLHAQIANAGGMELNWNDTSNYRNNRYFTTQLRDGKIILPYAGKTASIADRYAGVDLTYSAYYRFVFAF